MHGNRSLTADGDNDTFLLEFLDQLDIPATADPRSPASRQGRLGHIVERGHEMVERFEALAAELPGTIVKVQGTGLLMAAELNPDQFVVLGETCTEKFCRHHGLGVIHGGKNALRFTPHFHITSIEIELVVDLVRTALLKGPRKSD